MMLQKPRRPKLRRGLFDVKEPFFICFTSVQQKQMMRETYRAKMICGNISTNLSYFGSQ
jgi:hypothetical protein